MEREGATREKPRACEKINAKLNDESNETDQKAVDSEIREYLKSKGAYPQYIIDSADSNQLLVYYVDTKN
jgi:hypothetical protein